MLHCTPSVQKLPSVQEGKETYGIVGSFAIIWLMQQLAMWALYPQCAGRVITLNSALHNL